MNRLPKIGLVGLTGVTLVAIILAFLSAIAEPEITRLFIKRLNSSLQNHTEIKQVDFSLIKSFPRASVTLKNIVVASYGIDESTPESDSVPLFTAESINLSLRITALLKKNYIIDRLSVENGVFNISRNNEGDYNFKFNKAGQSSDTLAFTADLRNIQIKNTHINFNDERGALVTSVAITEASSRLKISDHSISAETAVTLDNLRLKAGKFTLPLLPGRIKSKISLSEKKGSITINRLTLNSGDIEAEFSGNINSNSGNTALMFIYSSGVEEIIAFMGDKGVAFLNRYNPAGLVSLSGSIAGTAAKGGNLNLYSEGEVKGGTITIPSNGFRIKNIRAPLVVAIDLMNINSVFRLAVDRYTASAESEPVSGSFIINRIKNPVIDFRLNATPDLSILQSLTKTSSLKASGKSELSLRLYGPVKNQGNNGSFLLSLDRSANLFLRNARVEIPDYGFSANDINGNIMVADNIWFDAVALTYCGSKTILNGKLSRFDDLAANRGHSPSVSAAIWTEKISDAMLVPFTTKKDDQRGSQLFSRSDFNLDIRSDSIALGKFRAAALNTTLSYREKSISISSFRLNILDGSVEGNATVLPLSGERYAGRGWFNINGIDINKSFTLFNNFGQSYITDNNIRGNLTGEITLSGETFTGFKPDPSSIIVGGNYLISNGELIEFEPILKLSRYVELSELEKIKFSELSNEISIRNRNVIIPSMEISSSAFNISLSGNHSFDGNYTYHLRLLLSEVLSRKRENNKTRDPFGSVEDDGLGQTTLFLKVEGDRNGSRVSHDMKSLRSKIKRDMEKEKSNLRTILNEEYGWHKDDSVTVPAKEETKRFRIIWEEGDSAIINRDLEEEKRLPLKNILLRKKKEKG